jgi:hypothetical protein
MVPPGPPAAAIAAAAATASPVMGWYQGVSVVALVSRVAMIRPSSLATFWALQPWMNPPPRTGMRRESGSVTFRLAGCSFLSFLSFFPGAAAARSARAAARSRARSSSSRAQRTRK